MRKVFHNFAENYQPDKTYFWHFRITLRGIDVVLKGQRIFPTDDPDVFKIEGRDDDGTSLFFNANDVVYIERQRYFTETNKPG